jgi:paraquat-inducible protein B
MSDEAPGGPPQDPRRAPPEPRSLEESGPHARLRSRSWFSWAWAVPLGAAAIVIWLAWRTLAERGPAITISFKNVDGLQAGQTKIQHRNVDIGTVESLDLPPTCRT